MILKILSSTVLTSLLVSTPPAWADEAEGTVCSPPGEPAQTKEMKGRALTQQEQFKKSYDKAECLRRAAAVKGAEWLETENLLLLSLEETEEGRWKSALALVEKARFQAEQALRQAEHEAEAWKQRVLE